MMDKKKTNIEIVDTDIFSIGTDGGNKPIKPINLDKKKPKELDKEIRKICTYYSELGEGTCGYNLSEEQFEKLFNLIDSTLTRQRTELLEEILGLEWLKEEKVPERGEVGWLTFKVRNNLRRKIKEEIKNYECR
jgi:ribosomal protein S13